MRSLDRSNSLQFRNHLLLNYKVGKEVSRLLTPEGNDDAWFCHHVETLFT